MHLQMNTGGKELENRRDGIRISSSNKLTNQQWGAREAILSPKKMAMPVADTPYHTYPAAILQEMGIVQAPYSTR